MKMTNFLPILLKSLLYIIFYLKNLNIRLYLKLNSSSLFILVRKDGFKLEGDELFKEGFRKLLRQE